MKILKVLVACTFLLNSYFTFAGDTKKTISDTKTWNKSFNVNSNARFNLSSRESEINITTWNENRIEIKVTLTIEAFEQEEINKLFTAFEPSISGNPSEVTVSNPACIEKVISTPSKMRLKINNQIIKVKEYHFRFDVKMPATNSLNLKNRFGEVVLGNHKAEVDLELYECDVKGAQINSTKTLASLKFSDGTLGASKDMVLNTYESDLNLTEIGLLNMNAKFSEIQFLKVTNAKIDAYESELDLGQTNSVTIKQSFGKLKIAEAKTLNLTSYELDFETGKIENLNLPSSKFSKVTCGMAGDIVIGEAYENRMTFGEAKSIEMEAKFSQVDIGKLEKSLTATGYELRLVIGEVSSNFSKLSLSAKFSNADFKLKGNPGYNLKASLSYGNIEFPNENLQDLKVDKKGNQVNVSGRTKGYNGNASISVSGYETDVTLSYH